MSCAILNKEHFRKTLVFAKQSHPKTRRSFKNQLSCLNRIKRNYKATLKLEPDFVEHSFIFSFERNSERIGLWGGFILHGYEETFSVEITNLNYPHWSLHT